MRMRVPSPIYISSPFFSEPMLWPGLTPGLQ